MIRRLLRRQRPLPEVEHVIRVAGTGEEFAVSREGFLKIVGNQLVEETYEVRPDATWKFAAHFGDIEEDSMNDTRFTVIRRRQDRLSAWRDHHRVVGQSPQDQARVSEEAA